MLVLLVYCLTCTFYYAGIHVAMSKEGNYGSCYESEILPDDNVET
jgi:hypothetical protein